MTVDVWLDIQVRASRLSGIPVCTSCSAILRRNRTDRLRRLTVTKRSTAGGIGEPIAVKRKRLVGNCAWSVPAPDWADVEMRTVGAVVGLPTD